MLYIIYKCGKREKMDTIPVLNEEIIKLINARTEQTADKISHYTRLLDCLMDENDKRVLEDIILTKIKHLHMLSELHYKFTGMRPRCAETLSPSPDSTPSSDEKNISSENLPEEFRCGALSEITSSELARSLKFSFLNRQIRDTLEEIMTDDQNNAQRFSILLTKYAG